MGNINYLVGNSVDSYATIPPHELEEYRMISGFTVSEIVRLYNMFFKLTKGEKKMSKIFFF